MKLKTSFTRLHRLLVGPSKAMGRFAPGLRGEGRWCWGCAGAGSRSQLAGKRVAIGLGLGLADASAAVEAHLEVGCRGASEVTGECAPAEARLWVGAQRVRRGRVVRATTATRGRSAGERKEKCYLCGGWWLSV